MGSWWEPGAVHHCVLQLLSLLLLPPPSIHTRGCQWLEHCLLHLSPLCLLPWLPPDPPTRGLPVVGTWSFAFVATLPFALASTLPSHLGIVSGWGIVLCICLHCAFRLGPHPTLPPWACQWLGHCPSPLLQFRIAFAFALPSLHGRGGLDYRMRLRYVFPLHLLVPSPLQSPVLVCHRCRFFRPMSWRGWCLFTRLCLMYCAQAHTGYCVPSGIGVSHWSFVFAFCLRCLHGVLVKTGGGATLRFAVAFAFVFVSTLPLPSPCPPT